MRTKPINTEALNSLLPACSKEAFNFTLLSCSLELRHDHISKVAGLVLSWYKSAALCIKIPTRVKSCWHRLTHQVGIQSTRINTNNRFAYVWRLSDKSFINKCFACKNDRWTTNNILSSFLRPVLICLRHWIDFNICSFEETNVGQIW